MMAKHTRVPELMGVLNAAFSAQPEIDPVALVLGGRAVNDYRDYILFLGYRPNSDEWVTVNRSAPQGLRPNDTESVSVGNLLAVTNGEDDMQAALDLAGEKFAAVERVITGDMTLGMGKGVKAWIASHAWLPLHTEKGAECNVRFEITVEGLL